MAHTGLKPETSGAGAYRYLLGAAILECIEDRHDEIRFATSLEVATDIAEPLIQTYKAWWDSAMIKALRTDEGEPILDDRGNVIDPDAEICKASRHKQLAAIMLLARKGGIFDRRKTPFDKQAMKFFEAQNAGGEEAVAAGADEDEVDVDEDQDTDDVS